MKPDASEPTPISEVNSIMEDLSSRFVEMQPLLLNLWNDFSFNGVDEAVVKDTQAKTLDYFTADRRLRGPDIGNCIILTVAHCVAAKYYWAMGQVGISWSFVAAASKWHGIVCALNVACYNKAEAQAVRSAVAAAGAAAKIARDPFQKDKATAKELWYLNKEPGGLAEYNNWRQKNPRERYSNASFAKFLCYRFPLFTSQKTVEGWITTWG